jgi:NTP pyrophosphatase (non-canonical NTP hydrolase)
MKKREEMLVITMEECGELIQACSKMIRFDEPNDTKQLQEEIGDVMCMIEILKDGGLVTDEQIQRRIKVKKEKLMKWSLLYTEGE